MFQNKNAWFSKSVSKNHISLWEKNGGNVVESVDTVCEELFLFSQNADSTDTKEIYTRDGCGYIVLHPLMIVDSVRTGALVTLADFILPPTRVQHMAKTQLGYRYVWEGSDASDVKARPPAQVNENGTREDNPLPTTQNRCSSGDDDYVDIEPRLAVRGALEEFRPGSENHKVIRRI